MSRRTSGFLLGLAIFMVVEWLMLARNLGDDHPTAFYVVHGILIAVNIVLAIVVGAIAIKGLRNRRTGEVPQ